MTGREKGEELNENALDQVSAGAGEVVKVAGPPAPFVASPLPALSSGGQAATLLGHEATHVQQGAGDTRLGA